MYRTLTLALATSIGLAVPATAAIVNFEYTVEAKEPVAGSPQLYQYDMRFFIDMDALEASGFEETFGIREFRVNVADIANPRAKPFGNGFVTDLTAFWFPAEAQSGADFDRISPILGPFWQPTDVYNEVRVEGVSEILADMTWNWDGRTNVDASSSLVSGTPGEPFGRLTASPLRPIDDDPVIDDPIGDGPAPIPLPAGFPLLLAALGGLAVARKRAS